jgi:cytochrome c
MNATRTSLGLAGLLTAAFFIGGAGAQTTVTDDQGRSEVIYEIGTFHPAPGAQITYDLCTACHSEMIIAQQGQTREGWDEILVWMVEEMGMAELMEEEREQVLDYLATYYNPDRPHFPQN